MKTLTKALIMVLLFQQVANASNQKNKAPFADLVKISNVNINTKMIQPKNTLTDNDIRIEQFGSIDAGATIAITIKETDASVLLSGIIADPDQDVGVSKIVDPNGETLYELDLSNDDVIVLGDLVRDVISNEGEFGLFLPLFPFGSGELKVGTYLVTLLTEDESRITNVTARYKNKTSYPQKIDLNFLFINSDPSLSNTVYLDNFFEQIQVELNKLLSPHQLQIGRVSYKIASQQVTQQYSTMAESQINNVCSELSNEFGNTRAVNIAYVDFISVRQDSETFFAGGVAPALPGIVMEPNSRKNCVFVSKGVYTGDLDVFSLISANILHEIGHLISFPHTTEDEGHDFDYFTDTPQCDASTYDTNNNGEVSDHECGFVGGADNFMFYAGHPDFAPFTISTQQATIMKAHPYFYPESSGRTIDASTTGAWYNPQQSGHGFMIEILPNNRMLATWYVFDDMGNQTWLLGLGSIEGSRATLDVTFVENGLFPPLFNANDVTRTRWGTFEFDLTDCNNMIVKWQTDVQGFTSGNLALTRLTSIDTLTCTQSR